MPTSPVATLRKLAGFVGALAVAGVLLASPAFAHHPETANAAAIPVVAAPVAAPVAPRASGTQAQAASSERPRSGVSAVALFVIGSIAVVIGGSVVLVTRRP
jgi:hypothetical protein